MIVSVHIGKCGGRNMLHTLERHFGNKLMPSYNDRPFYMSRKERNKLAMDSHKSNAIYDLIDRGIECVHGHFLAIKYLPQTPDPNIRFVTFMRDPVQRMMSHYQMFHRTNRAASLVEFLYTEQFTNYISQLLWRFPLENFDFIGMMENYAQDFELFCNKYFKKPMPVLETNINPDKPTNYISQQYTINDHDMKLIKKYTKKDMEIYKKAMAINRLQ